MTTTPAGDRLPPGRDGLPLLGETLAFAKVIQTTVERYFQLWSSVREIGWLDEMKRLSIAELGAMIQQLTDHSAVRERLTEEIAVSATSAGSRFGRDMATSWRHFGATDLLAPMPRAPGRRESATFTASARSAADPGRRRKASLPRAWRNGDRCR